MRRRGRPPHPDVLTPREWEVLALLRQGLSNDEIAQRLEISLAGAKYHVSEILGKLGVESRQEAARWRPERRPWWASALAPVALLWRKAGAGWLAPAAGVGAAAVVAGGIGLLVWGLLRTSGGDSAGFAALPSPTAMSTPGPTPTAVPNAPPLPTPVPFVAEPVDCPGGYATPEEAIGACYRSFSWFSDYEYLGNCDDLVDDPFPDYCSSWAEGATSPRGYAVSTAGADSFDWIVVERRDDGWVTTDRATCGGQHLVDIEQARIWRGMDLSEVRADDCSFAPPPLPRPTVRVGPGARISVDNGYARLSVGGGAFYPGRGVSLSLSIENTSEATKAWTPVLGSEIALVTEDGRRLAASEIGGTLARSVPEGLPPNARWGGWVVFPVEEFGTYILRYPGQPEVTLELTAEYYDASRKEFLEDPTGW